MALLINVDGGSRGNPGPAGAGVVIRSESGERIHEAGYFLGTQTNNVAEYMALIRGLQRAARCAPQPLVIRSDSELLVRQMTGEYRVKNEKLADLNHEAQLLLLRVGAWQFRHVRREENGRADELANLAMDQRRDVIAFDLDPEKTGGTSPQAPTTAAKKRRNRASKEGEPTADADVEDSNQPGAARGVRVDLTTPPGANGCVAGDWGPASFVVNTTLPAGMCVFAAHALVPTILAVQNTEVAEFASVPTLTLRCMRDGCLAAFHIAPVAGANGNGWKSGQ